MIYQYDPQVIITREVRASYVAMAEPRTTDANGKLLAEPEYQMTILVPKSDTQTIAEMKQAIDAAVSYAKSRPVSRNGWGDEDVYDPYSCIMDGDGRMPKGKAWGPECAGHWVIRTKCKVSKSKPFVITRRALNEPFIQVEPRDIYSGMYGRAQVRFSPYNNNGNKGVSCFIQGFFKTRDGEPLNGVAPANPEDTFAGVVAEGGYTGGAVDPITGQPMQYDPITGQPLQR